MSTTPIAPACALTDASAGCYTASWFLVWDQVRYWLLFQLPVVAISIVFEWLDLASHKRVERLRTLFDAPLPNAINYLLQIVTCVYCCIAWVVRGGSLAVSFSSWSVESLFLIATAVGYGTRWLAAKHKVAYTLQLHSLFDLLSVVSHFALNLQTVADGDRYRRSWLDFGFLRSYIGYVVVDHLVSRYKHNKSFFSQVLLVVFKAWVLVFFAACVLFSLERLGEIPYTNSFLLHVYKCSAADDTDGTNWILLKNASGTEAFPNCSETWSFFSSIYFMFVTVSTVGYGDFSPKTVLGQLMVCVIIVFGIYTFANESAALMTIYGDQRNGRVKYNVSRNTVHVIVTGNPSAAQMKDFIREFFHPDHDVVFQGSRTADGDEDDDNDEQRSDKVTDDERNMDARRSLQEMHVRDNYEAALEEGRNGLEPAEAMKHLERSGSGALVSKWMKRRGANRVRETHIVVLMRFDKDDDHSSFQSEIEEYVHDNPRYHKRVFFIYGSPLHAKDLEHARLSQAMAVFFLPNKFSNDGNQEDAATVLRVLSVSQSIEPHTQLFAMLVNSENRTLLEATGLSSDHLVCADELRLGLMGLSCRCPGLSTLVSNLITSRSNGDTGERTESADHGNPSWIAEYVAGAANEIYSCSLAPHFTRLTFTEVAQRIHKQSGGLVLLIAIELDGEISFNPGRWFRITAACKAYLIAESVGALEPFAGSSSFHSAEGALVTNLAMIRGRENLLHRARRAQHNVERRIPTSVREYIRRCSSGIGSFQTPTAPSAALLAKGGHIVVCSNAANEGGGIRSISRLVNFLQPLRAPHIESILPVVLVDSEKFDSISWLQLSQFGEVYHVQGSPQRHNVLVAAGIYSASSIVVLAQGNEAGYDDSKAIFNAILVNSALQNSSIFTIIELRDVHNNKFLDPVASFSSRSFDDDDSIMSEYDAHFSPVARHSHGRSSQGHGGLRQSLRANSSFHGARPSASSAATAKMKSSWLATQTRRGREIFFYARAFFMGSLMPRMHAFGGNSSPDPRMPSLEALYNHDDEDDTFFQERFMSGALFPSYVADDLLIQSFFNPSLNVFIRSILDGQSCFMLYDVPKQWRHQQPALTYGDLFVHMTSGMAHALPIGLLRCKGGATSAPYPYVYTCPASSTIVYPEDKIFVIIDVQALHRVANKLQRKFRKRKNPADFGAAVDAAMWRRSTASVAKNKTL
uniref:Potassium channel domain-containing protein n=1 Tax=Globisporangium ultimum (strain ATCC 200006 / CBS 805.95 / DAOM BR144) TaxID=431595 RepID=K3WY09_GLOUD